MWTYWMVLWAIGNESRAEYAMRRVAANAIEIMAFEEQ